jgi:hypothetical protein
MHVVDIQNNRVLIFEPPLSNGMNATTVLGQAGFTSGAINQTGNVGANTLDQVEHGITF